MAEGEPSMELSQIAEHLKSDACQNVVFAVGAGISCSAGIPDFRSKGTGLYDNMDKYGLKDARPEDVMTLEFHAKHPEVIYKIDRMILPLNRWLPTRSHFFMKLLLDKGKLRRVYTQNIDCLERKAGIPADALVEAHGSFASCSCMECSTPADIDEFERIVMTDPIVPMRCACGGLIKADVIHFNEPLPERFMDRKLVDGDLGAFDLLLVSGTSLLVQPFNSIPLRVREECPRVLINRDPVGVDSGEKFGASVLDLDIKMNTHVELTDGSGRRGKVKWIGRVRELEGKRFYGVELETPQGNNDGSVGGRSYFYCEPNYGVFVKKSKLRSLEQTRRKMRKMFEFKKPGTNDMFVQGDADDGFRKLAQLCGGCNYFELAPHQKNSA